MQRLLAAILLFSASMFAQTVCVNCGGGFSNGSNADSNTAELFNGTNPQILNVYATRTDASNYERMAIQYNAGQTRFNIGMQKAGTGTSRPLDMDFDGIAFRSQAGSRNIGWTMSGGGRQNLYAGLTSIDAVVTRGTNVASTGLVANVGATTIVTGAAGTAGLYRVCYQASTTTSGTGTTGTITLAWNDGNAKSFTTGTFALNAVDITGQVNGCQTFRLAASQNITIATTIGAIGTSVYRLDASAEQLQ